MLISGFPECAEDEVGGDPGVCGDVERGAGVVVEPGDDLGVAAGGESVVGEVGLPGLVGLFGLESDVGAFRTLLGFGFDQAQAGQGARDGGVGDLDSVVVLQVPGDGRGAGVEALFGECFA